MFSVVIIYRYKKAQETDSVRHFFQSSYLVTEKVSSCCKTYTRRAGTLPPKKLLNLERYLEAPLKPYTFIPDKRT